MLPPHRKCELTHFRDSGTEGPSSNCVRDIPFSPNARLVVHDLTPPIQVPPPQRTVDVSHIRRDLQCGIRLLQGWTIVALIAVDPGTVQAQNEAFSVVGHCVPPNVVG